MPQSQSPSDPQLGPRRALHWRTGPVGSYPAVTFLAAMVALLFTSWGLLQSEAGKDLGCSRRKQKEPPLFQIGTPKIAAALALAMAWSTAVGRAAWQHRARMTRQRRRAATGRRLNPTGAPGSASGGWGVGGWLPADLDSTCSSNSETRPGPLLPRLTRRHPWARAAGAPCAIHSTRPPSEGVPWAVPRACINGRVGAAPAL